MQQTVRESPFDADFVAMLQALATEIFGRINEGDLAWKLSRMPDPSVQAAYDETQLIGFKFGYAVSKLRYYSWLGGVRPEYRRQGIARRLMAAQHDWARRRGYATIETGTIKNNVPMLQLNLSSGFEIIGTYCRDDMPRVILHKRL